MIIIIPITQLKVREEQHAQALKKQKTTLLAAEKEKRDQLLNEKGKEIKEMTIRGLEPEIQKMISVSYDYTRIEDRKLWTDLISLDSSLLLNQILMIMY